MARFSSTTLARFLLSASGAFAALTVDVEDAASIKKAAAVVAKDLMSYYTGEIPGILPGPPPDGDYYWWAGGALWTAMLDYRSRTSDTQYDDTIKEALLFQRSENNDYLPANWSASAANDDQAIWGLAAMLAAETGFTAPGEDDLKSWSTLAQNVFEEQSSDSRRVAKGDCKGGLRWQIYLTNNGYNYVATSANAAFANLAARLAVWDGNSGTSAVWVQDTFQFLEDADFIDSDFNVFDGATVPDCDAINKVQSSYTAALLLESAAVMYNSSNGDDQDEWRTRVDGLLQRTIDVFFPDGVATEVSCESHACNTDMAFFKSFLHRSLAATMKAAPHTESQILPVLKTSAKAAVSSCVNGDNGRMCGLLWSGDSNADDEVNAGSQMSVLSALLSLLPEGQVVNSSDSASGSGTGSNATSSTTISTPTGTSFGQSTASTTPDKDNLGAHAGVSSIALLGALLLSFALN
ncbi:glycosyl hydrolase family 76-domain-containing protein [Xylaria arbuscula]|nr:glycosyl hydrolase family 76-domain-containing protein [Xylaria arbuscula]